MDKFALSLDWPTAATIVAVVLAVIFRRELGQLISRTKKVGATGLETYDASTPPTQPERKGVEEFIRSFDNPLLVEAEAAIAKDLKDRNINSPADRERTLIRALASQNILGHFERVANSVWASQMLLLRFANTQAAGVPLADAKLFYDDAKSKFAAWYENYTFERWLGFLESHKLIQNSNGTLLISAAGREFLKYHVHTGRSGPNYG
jgi:hypothetical protein